MIVAAVDRQPDEAKVVHEGHTLADAFDYDFHVLHVHASKTSVMDGIQDLAADRARSIAERETKDFEAVGRVGNVATEIVDYAREQDARYIVLGRKRRSPVEKAILGSVSQSVVLKSDQPVVTVSKD